MNFVLPAFLLGFLGSFHCVVMCVPIMVSVPVFSVNGLKIIREKMVYQAGRISTYIIIGLVFFIIGQSFFLVNFQNILAILIGSALVLYSLPNRFFPFKFNRGLSQKIWQFFKKIFSQIISKKTLLSRFILGVCNGFLPCGLVYMAALSGVLQESVSANISYMLWFGLGTLPTLFFFLWLGQKVKKSLGTKLYKVIPYFLFVLGILFIIRGLSLNLPYLSPVLDYTVGQISNC